MPVIVQESSSGQILMLGFSNEGALKTTLETGMATFWSRSRNELWTKGKTSGDALLVDRILTDCDQDTLLYLVTMAGKGACHTGEKSCFNYEIGVQSGEIQKATAPLDTWSRTFREEEQMMQEKTPEEIASSSTAFGIFGDLNKALRKFGEEAVEVSTAFAGKALREDISENDILGEVADLLYRLQILLVRFNIPWGSVEGKIKTRRSWIIRKGEITPQ